MTGYTTQGDLVIVDGHIVVVVVERSTDDEGEVTRVFGHLCPATDVGHGSFLDDVFMDETEGPVTWGEIRKLFHQWLSYEIDWWNAETALREHPSDKQVKRILAALEPKVTALLAEVFPPAPADDLVWVGERRLYRLVAGCVAEYHRSGTRWVVKLLERSNTGSVQVEIQKVLAGNSFYRPGHRVVVSGEFLWSRNFPPE